MKRILLFLSVLAACTSPTEPVRPGTSQSIKVSVKDTIIAATDLTCRSGYNVATGRCMDDSTAAQQATVPDVVSKIFAGDPKRPGAGYVTWNGATYRIEGTSFAGGCDWCFVLPAGTFYYLDDSKGHDLIHGPVVDTADFYKWVNSFHAPNTP